MALNAISRYQTPQETSRTLAVRRYLATLKTSLEPLRAVLRRFNAYPAIPLPVNHSNVLNGLRIVLTRLCRSCEPIALLPQIIIIIVNRYHGTRDNITGLRGKQAVISAREGAGQGRGVATARPLKLTKANTEHQFGFFICEKVVDFALDLLTYPAVCALPLEPLAWYNGYVKRGKGKNMENPQLQTNECSPLVSRGFSLSSATQPSIGVFSVSPRGF